MTDPGREARVHARDARFSDNIALDPVRGGEPAGTAARTGEGGPHAGRVAAGVVRACRPRQWVKNGLVLAAPLVSGRLLAADVLAATVLAFVLFCVVSSAVYLINDVRDAEEDRRHPTKRFRPIAAGVVPPVLAVVVALVLLGIAFAAALVLARPQLAVVLASYVAISVAYSFFLKDQLVIDLAVVASGFLLRGVAGGAAAGLALSQWFLLVAAFGALFMVAGKRYGELVALGGGGETRRSLTRYSPSYLRFVWSLSAGVCCTAYSLWAFELHGREAGFPWETLSIAPFVLALLRYAVDVDRGEAGTPEDIVLRDPVLLVLGVVWVGMVVAGVLAR